VALLRILLLAAAVLFITRWLLRMLSRTQTSRGGIFGKRGVSSPGKKQPKSRAKLKMLRFERRPHQILGVERDASRPEIDAALKHALEENDPSRLDDMSPELRTVAERRRQEINRAYQAMIGEE